MGDIDIMKGLGFKSFRLSLSWARILPDGFASNPNEKGVQFYKTLFAELKKAGIEP